ncbi:MAG: hypothetical protein M0Q87_09845 [Ottowia sp.]|nr:hypothetical protein [Ottowia sp.]
MKVWRQAFSVQRVSITLNAQPLQTLNLPIMAAQPQSLQPRSGKVIEAPARSSVMRVVLLSHSSPRGGPGAPEETRIQYLCKSITCDFCFLRGKAAA